MSDVSMQDPAMPKKYATAWKITQDFIHEHVRYWITKVNTSHSTLLEFHSLFVREGQLKYIFV